MLHDAINDPFFAHALDEFFSDKKQEHADLLLRAVRQPVRDTMKEARIAGMVEVYEECGEQLRHFAQEQLKEASQ